MRPFVGGRLDGAGVLDRHRQRLLHHHVDAARGGGLDDRTMVARRREGRDRLRLRALQEIVQRREHPVLGDLVALAERLAQRGVRLEHADQLHVGGAALDPPHEAGDVAVDEAGDGDADRPGRRRPAVVGAGVCASAAGGRQTASRSRTTALSSMVPDSIRRGPARCSGRAETEQRLLAADVDAPVRQGRRREERLAEVVRRRRVPSPCRRGRRRGCRPRWRSRCGRPSRPATRCTTRAPSRRAPSSRPRRCRRAAR